MMLHEFSTNTTTPAFFPKAMGSIHLLNTLRQKVGKAFPVGGINNSQSGMSIHQKHEERLNFEEFFSRANITYRFNLFCVEMSKVSDI